jgi:maleylpyruvate isomerase
MKTRDLPMLRWREVEVHTADLDAGVTFRDWDPLYVRYDLPRMTMMQTSRAPMGMSKLPDAALRLPEAERLAWLLGRHVPGGLEALQGL